MRGLIPIVLAALAASQAPAAVHPARAAETMVVGRSVGQRLYVPIYSSIHYLEGQELNFAVTVSIRNTDGSHPIEVEDVQYYGNQGELHDDPFADVGTLGPLASTQLTIPQSQRAGDVGANLIVVWRSSAPVTPPLIEAVMVGSSRAQGFAFTSRALVLEELR
jgi:hypothetical protein